MAVILSLPQCVNWILVMVSWDTHNVTLWHSAPTTHCLLQFIVAMIGFDYISMMNVITFLGWKMIDMIVDLVPLTNIIWLPLWYHGLIGWVSPMQTMNTFCSFASRLFNLLEHYFFHKGKCFSNVIVSYSQMELKELKGTCLIFFSLKISFHCQSDFLTSSKLHGISLI